MMALIEDMMALVADMTAPIEDMTVVVAALRCHIPARYSFVRHKVRAIA
jgi:hypothetical protein